MLKVRGPELFRAMRVSLTLHAGAAGLIALLGSQLDLGGSAPTASPGQWKEWNIELGQAGETGGRARTRAPKDSIRTSQSAPRRTEGAVAGKSLSPSALSTYLIEIHDRIQAALDYPETLQRRRIQGTVQMKLVLESDGTIKSSRVQTSSGFSSLDRQALLAVQAAQPFSPLPEGAPESLEIQVPIQFQLY